MQLDVARSAAAPTTAGAIVTPPINYSMLCPGVHRSGYPSKRNFGFLQTLKLKSIIFLCPEAYADSNLQFCAANGITLLTVPMEGNKEPFLDIPQEAMDRAMSLLCDTRHHPVLIHCNKGKHRTGTVCGCLRRLQGWSLASTFDEYLRFAGDKARFVDQQFIELYTAKVFHTGPPSFGLTPRWLQWRDSLVFISADSPEAAIVAIKPPGSDVDASDNKKEKKDKKDKKDKAEKADDATAASSKGDP